MRYLWWVCWLSLSLTACSALPNAEGTGGALLGFNMNTPEEVARSFLDAWSVSDTGAMYNLVASPSRAQFPPEAFTDRYTVFNDTVNISSMTYTVHDVLERGESAQVTYDVIMQSPTFGEISDAGRTMYLVRENNEWRVAWSTMDILKGMAEDVRLQVDSALPARANIYDRNGNALVEENRPIKWLAIVKQDLPNEEDCVQLLARVLLRSAKDLREVFAGYNSDTLFNVGELDVDLFNANEEALNATCALNTGNFVKSGEYTSRHYVGQGAMTHVAGFISSIPAEQVETYQARGYAASDLVGLAGIEATYQDLLAGKPEKVLRLVEPGGSTLRTLGAATGSEPTSIQLTIDRDLQLATARAINDAFNYAEPNWASVAGGAAAVVIDIKTGEILALASYPTFDPALFNRENNTYSDPLAEIAKINSDRRVPLSNKAVQEQYTPGSIYKLITATAITDEGIWNPNTIFDCTLEWNGQARFGDSLVRRQDWRVADGMDAAGPVTTVQAIATSCNPFFWETGALLYEEDANALVKYSEMFGLGRRVGMNVLGREAAGSNAAPQNSTQAINNAIGQGDIQVNPLQYAMAIAAIANEGTLFAPMLVKQIGGFDGVAVQEQFSPQVRGTITLPDVVWDTVKQGMCLATVDPVLGTARFAFGTGTPYSVCGKTGTAETGDRDSGSPPHGWFVSFSPAEDPQIATLVVVTYGREGSETSAPITRRILDTYYNVEQAPFPEWWTGPYIPMTPPEGVAG